MVVLQENTDHPASKNMVFLSKVFSIGGGKIQIGLKFSTACHPKKLEASKVIGQQQFWERGFLENPGFILN